ncbi:MAG: tetratricopeptide repeat protein, partial [Lentisphaerae bacterium]|nr:tetratricopeptide repeat protein [Lentisphaerota bacterium]
PVMVLFVEGIVNFRGSLRDALRQRWVFYACLAATWVVLAGVGRLRQDDPAELVVWGRVSPLLYAVTQASVIVRYLRLSFWPQPLVFDYRWPPAEHFAQDPAAFVVVAVLVVLTVWLLWRRSPAALPGAWFFGVLAPTSSFVARPDMAFEHRMYLPLAGVIAVVVVGGYLLLRRRARPSFLCLLALLLVCGMGCVTHRRNRDYSTEVSMWSDVVRKAPHNLRAWNDLAVALSEEGRVEEALGAYEHVLAAIPAATLGALDTGELRVVEEIPTDAFEFHYFRAHANMGLLYLKVLGDPEAAVGHYAAALRAIPHHGDLRKKLRHAMKAARIPDEELDAAVQRAIQGDTP